MQLMNCKTCHQPLPIHSTAHRRFNRRDVIFFISIIASKARWAAAVSAKNTTSTFEQSGLRW
jgi:hypothetical protein